MLSLLVRLTRLWNHGGRECRVLLETISTPMRWIGLNISGGQVRKVAQDFLMSHSGGEVLFWRL